MGITLFHAELIVREHLFRPLPKTVHLLGRQTVLFDANTAMALMRKYGIKPAQAEVKLDTSTVGAIVADRGYITDTSFFQMLGVNHINAIDHSDYEGAEIIVDLNQPLPSHLEQVADFIFGGSVLDNIFDPASYIKNVTRMLKQGGRLIDQNICSFHHHPYILASPAWYYDYFVSNGFADCKLYLCEVGSVTHVYGLKVEPQDPIVCDFGNASVSIPCGIVVIAERGPDSTWDRVPAQDQYRSASEWDSYRLGHANMLQSKRPYLIFSTPSQLQILKQPLRKIRSFQYLGHHAPFAPNDYAVDKEVAISQEQVSGGIRVIEATYGWNNLRSDMKIPAVYPMCRGNVTDTVAGMLNGENGADIMLDVELLGDPAPALAKDLHILYYYDQDPMRRLCLVSIEAEAHGQKLVIAPYG